MGLAAGFVLLAVLLSVPAPARARPNAAAPVLVTSSPAPAAVLGESPAEVVLTFDRALVERGTWISVTDDTGTRHDRDDMHIDDDDRFSMKLSLNPLPEGHYRVQYNAASLGGSTVTAGSLDFTVDLPDPRLEMRAPVSGTWYEDGEVPLEFGAQFVDFTAYDSRIRVIVDGEVYDELQVGEGMITGLEPGVHRVEAVLVRFEDEVLPATRHTAYVAVVEQPVEEAPYIPPWENWFGLPERLRIIFSGWPWTIALTLALLGLGMLLGAATRRSEAS